MKRLRQFVIVLLALGMLNLTGCEWRRKPKLPQQASAPTRLPEPEGPKPVTPEPVTQPEVNDTTPAPVETANSTKPKPKPKRVPKKIVPAEPATGTANTAPPVVAKNTTPAEAGVQITAEVPKSAAIQQRQSTAQLLEAAETNLRKISRSLNDGEQAMMRQIRTYIAQSKTATTEGDLERAYNLAVKANLLSSELAK